MVEQLQDAIANMREEEALETAKKMLDGGVDPIAVLQACRDALETVGKRFEAGEYFLPELIISGEMFSQISALAKPLLKTDENREFIGKVLIGTVEGDVHDLGKNIVTFMLEVNGLEVLDLGVDVPADRFVEAIREFKPSVVGLSGLLTLAYDAMKVTVEAIGAAGLRDGIVIIVGGASIDERVREYTGADHYGPDALAAVSLAKNHI